MTEPPGIDIARESLTVAPSGRFQPWPFTRRESVGVVWSQLELSFGAIWLTRYPGLLSYILITPRPVAENRFCPVMPYENAWNRLFCFDSRKTTPATCSLFALTCFNYQKPSNADAVCHFMRKPEHPGR